MKKKNTNSKQEFSTHTIHEYYSHCISRFVSRSTPDQLEKFEYTCDSELFHLHLILGDSMYVDELPPTRDIDQIVYNSQN